MTDNTNILNENAVTGQGGEETKGVTAEYLLYLIEKMADDTDYLKNAVNQMGCLQGNSDADGVADGIARIVWSREETNRQILKLYEKMYDDAVGQRTDLNHEDMQWLFTQAFSTISGEDDSDTKLEMFNTLFSNLDKLI